MKKVKLTEEKIKIIKSYAELIFGKDTEVYLFGSRTDLSKKGGNIDLLILTKSKENLFKKKLIFLSKLYKNLGEQKIDVIITEKPKSYIELKAINSGVKL